ncbi:hypothetical protein [Streptomyces sp. STR69]|nr:hypothetical protein [Streptomyces sp. STR69]
MTFLNCDVAEAVRIGVEAVGDDHLAAVNVRCRRSRQPELGSV